MPEDSIAIDTKSTVRRGGARAGAGRPRGAGKYLLARGIPIPTAAEILALHDVNAIWRRLLNSPDHSIQLRAVAFLSQMAQGAPARQINITQQTLHFSAADLERARAIVRDLRAGDRPSTALATAPAERAPTPLMLGSAEGGEKEGNR